MDQDRVVPGLGRDKADRILGTALRDAVDPDGERRERGDGEQGCGVIGRWWGGVAQCGVRRRVWVWRWRK